MMLPANGVSLLQSRPVWGAWIEMATAGGDKDCDRSRAPYGARGLKYHVRGQQRPAVRRAPYGARGLKCPTPLQCTAFRRRRAPYGARGLKCRVQGTSGEDTQVAPRMGRVD